MVQDLTVSINAQLKKKLNNSEVELHQDIIEELENELQTFEVIPTDDVD